MIIMRRAIFFAKGVVETVKKIELGSRYHSCSWLDGYVLPIYMNITINEALFSDTKIVTSVYSQSFEGIFRC
jgi:starch synthase